MGALAAFQNQQGGGMSKGQYRQDRAERAGGIGINPATGKLFTGQAQDFEQMLAGIDELERGYAGTRRMLKPTMRTGLGAYEQQAALTGALGGKAQRQAFKQFQQSPGQQFMQQQAEKALLRNAAVTGNLGGGNTQQELMKQAVGFAQQDYNNYFNRLGSVAQPGLGIQSQLGGYRTGLGQDLANIRGGFSAQDRQSTTGDQDKANIVSGLSALAMSDKTLKTDIQKVGEHKGINFYNWKWNEKAEKLGYTGRQFGVIAQELQEIHPEAVVQGEHLMVDTNKLVEILEAA